MSVKLKHSCPQRSIHICYLSREVRKQTGLTQEQFAAPLGVVFSTLDRWENGRPTPSPMAVKLIKQQVQQLEKRGRELLERYFAKSGELEKTFILSKVSVK